MTTEQKKEISKSFLCILATLEAQGLNFLIFHENRFCDKHKFDWIVKTIESYCINYDIDIYNRHFPYEEGGYTNMVKLMQLNPAGLKAIAAETVRAVQRYNEPSQGLIPDYYWA